MVRGCEPQEELEQDEHGGGLCWGACGCNHMLRGPCWDKTFRQRLGGGRELACGDLKKNIPGREDILRSRPWRVSAVFKEHEGSVW